MSFPRSFLHTSCVAWTYLVNKNANSHFYALLSLESTASYSAPNGTDVRDWRFVVWLGEGTRNLPGVKPQRESKASFGWYYNSMVREGIPSWTPALAYMKACINDKVQKGFELIEEAKPTGGAGWTISPWPIGGPWHNDHRLTAVENWPSWWPFVVKAGGARSSSWTYQVSDSIPVHEGSVMPAQVRKTPWRGGRSASESSKPEPPVTNDDNEEDVEDLIQARKKAKAQSGASVKALIARDNRARKKGRKEEPHVKKLPEERPTVRIGKFRIYRSS